MANIIQLPDTYTVNIAITDNIIVGNNNNSVAQNTNSLVYDYTGTGRQFRVFSISATGGVRFVAFHDSSNSSPTYSTSNVFYHFADQTNIYSQDGFLLPINKALWVRNIGSAGGSYTLNLIGRLE